MGLFNYTKAGKGVSKEDTEKSGLGLYFDVLGRRIWKFLTLNLIYLVVSIPAILISWAISSFFTTYLMSVSGTDVVENAGTITLVSIFLAVILFQVFGSGPATVSLCHILRKYVNDKHSWIFSDFFEQFKKNFRQGIVVYIINTVVSAALILAYIFYTLMLRNSLGDILSIVILVISAFFIMMQLYTYQLVADFEFKIKDIYKNSFLLTMIKLPWNVIVMVITAIIMYAMYSVALTSPFLAIMLFAVIYIVLVNYTQLFMTGNVIKKYILDPILEEKE